MIAIYDIDKSLSPFLKKKINGNENSIYEIENNQELIDIISNNLNVYEKVHVNAKGLGKDEIKNIIIPLLDTTTKQAKVLIYEFNGNIPYLQNTKLFSKPIKKDNEKDLNLTTHKKIGLSSKFEHLLIGISTGGPPTLEIVLPQFPADIPVSIVVIQHMLRGNHIYHLCDRLNKISQIEVKVAEDGETLRKGVAYFPPPGFHLYYNKQTGGEVKIQLSPEYLKRENSTLFDKDKKFVHVPSVDIGLESAADLYKDKLISAILTGMGSDGAIALKYAKSAGAHTLSQDESTSIIYGMPKAAYEKGGSMEVLKHYLIPNRILEILKY